jgi:uncharacterized protein YdaL
MAITIHHLNGKALSLPNISLLGSKWATRSSIGWWGNAVAQIVLCCFVLLALESGARAESLGPVLVLYDRTGESGYLGELYAMGMGTLVSHFGAWRAEPVGQYRAGELAEASAVIYIGSSYDEPLPRAFLDDVRDSSRPVLWLADNIWQLSAAMPDFAARYGYTPGLFTHTELTHVVYKGMHLDRDAENTSVLQLIDVNVQEVSVLAWAEAESGRHLPWAVRSQRFFYIAENPLAFIGPTDRYLVLCDLLFDLLAPDTTERHRALVRIEDVHAGTSPEALRAFADYFASQSVPFSIALVPLYTDPLGTHNHGVPMQRALHDAPAVVAALQYMIKKGGTLVLHGYTHQYAREKNPYSGASVDDFEFFRAHIDAQDNVVWDGPVAEDHPGWASERLSKAIAEVTLCGLPAPRIFEYPHYGGSVLDSREIAGLVPFAYQRENYYSGLLTGSEIDYQHSIALTFPYTVHDLYGWTLIPENLGNYVPVGYNNHGTTLVSELQRAARLHRVVRDGVASFFFHPIYELSTLRSVVEGIRAEGYTFVSPLEAQ